MAAPKRKSIEWLLDELPDLTSEKVIDYETGEALRQHYTKQLALPPDRSWVVLLFSAVGALLTGGGVILLIAHNWHLLGREARTVLAFLPVAVGQGLAGFTLLRRKDSVPWREGSGLFLALAAGAALALVSQTYNWDSNLRILLALWGCMTLPVLYLLGSSATAVLAAAIFCWWGFALDHGPSNSIMIHWIGIAAVMPHVVMVWLRRPDGPRLQFLAFTLPVIGALAIFPVQGRTAGLWIPMWVGYAAALWLLDALALRGRLRPVMIFSSGILVFLGLLLGFGDSWRNSPPASSFQYGGPVLFMTGWLVAAIVLGVANFIRRPDGLNAFVGAIAPLSLLGLFMNDSSGGQAQVAILTNLCLFGFGGMIVRRGVRTQSLKTANLGMCIIVAQALLRFLDRDWTFLARGSVFMIVGAGFLAINWRMTRAPKSVKEEEIAA